MLRWWFWVIGVGLVGFLVDFERSSVGVVHKGGLLIGASEAGAVAAWIEGLMGCFINSIMGIWGFFKGGVLD